jgi:hypothetical protein
VGYKNGSNDVENSKSLRPDGNRTLLGPRVHTRDYNAQSVFVSVLFFCYLPSDFWCRGSKNYTNVDTAG